MMMFRRKKPSARYFYENMFRRDHDQPLLELAKERGYAFVRLRANWGEASNKRVATWLSENFGHKNWVFVELRRKDEFWGQCGVLFTHPEHAVLYKLYGDPYIME